MADRLSSEESARFCQGVTRGLDNIARRRERNRIAQGLRIQLPEHFAELIPSGTIDLQPSTVELLVRRAWNTSTRNDHLDAGREKPRLQGGTTVTQSFHHDGPHGGRGRPDPVQNEPETVPDVGCALELVAP